MPVRTDVLALINDGTELWRGGAYPWWQITLPQSGWHWGNIVASPKNSEHWLIWGGQALNDDYSIDDRL